MTESVEDKLDLLIKLLEEQLEIDTDPPRFELNQNENDLVGHAYLRISEILESNPVERSIKIHCCGLYIREKRHEFLTNKRKDVRVEVRNVGRSASFPPDLDSYLEIYGYLDWNNYKQPIISMNSWKQLSETGWKRLDYYLYNYKHEVQYHNMLLKTKKWVNPIKQVTPIPSETSSAKSNILGQSGNSAPQSSILGQSEISAAQYCEEIAIFDEISDEFDKSFSPEKCSNLQLKNSDPVASCSSQNSDQNENKNSSLTQLVISCTQPPCSTVRSFDENSSQNEIDSLLRFYLSQPIVSHTHSSQTRPVISRTQFPFSKQRFLSESPEKPNKKPRLVIDLTQSDNDDDENTIDMTTLSENED